MGRARPCGDSGARGLLTLASENTPPRPPQPVCRSGPATADRPPNAQADVSDYRTHFAAGSAAGRERRGMENGSDGLRDAATVTQAVAVPPGDVWAVLSDGWLYPLWVVGASRIRGVDDHWPEPGSCLHHSVGIWPLVVDDTTEVLACEPGYSLLLRARAWPSGEAQVLVSLRTEGQGTSVTIREDAVAGPLRLVPGPLRRSVIAPRNVESMRRLAHLAEGRAGGTRTHALRSSARKFGG
jgi:hypothetical protein